MVKINFLKGTKCKNPKCCHPPPNYFKLNKKFPKILFLGYKQTSLIDFLSKNCELIISDESINASFCKEQNFDFLISYGYKFILKNDILSLFKKAAINLHISYLPYNRGSDPNFWSFMENSPKGVSIHYMDAGLDTGDIIAQKELFFDESLHSFASSYALLRQEIEKLFKDKFNEILSKNIKAKKQNGNFTYHKSSDKEPFMPFLKNGWDTNIAEFKAILKINGKI